ncbi:MAG: peptidylprolyl isomerase [Burkholderiales bacterium]|jgi:peptidyl-prolyl cis-trans isomerase A (cyclophilin A)/peptidyl-prolyl cis-trans isomerase B (cyclophilin B)|nr:peptidylprolyl isomerase [Burkholderiales bacterium]
MRTLLSILLLAVATAAHAADPRVELKTNRGVVVLELYPDKAPKTVANFLQYVKEGHYDGTVFHRVIDGFMIQGGGFDRDFRQKPTRAPVAIESEATLKAGLKNDYGTIAMARTADPNSATAQFFINVKNNDFLNFREPTTQGYGYTVFGRVVSGMDVVDKVAKSATGSGGPFGRDVPRDAVVIEKATLLPEK